MGVMLLSCIALFWGFAEATLFFIVPDVFLCFVSIKYSLRQTFYLTLYALIGAITGGVLIYKLGINYPETVYKLIVSLPAIDTDMMNEVRNKLQQSALSQMFIGAVTGVPYKVFAFEAGQQLIDLTCFILISIPARLFRWISIIVLVRLLILYLQKRYTAKQITKIFCVFWAIFYAVFFTLMPN
jgi:membrane protein YqaA with SNARE-associated domain